MPPWEASYLLSMRTALRELRRFIRLTLLEFGVDTENRLSAGLFMAGGISNQHRDRESSLMNPPPGLGGDQDEELDDEDDEETQRKSQLGARIADRE